MYDHIVGLDTFVGYAQIVGADGTPVQVPVTAAALAPPAGMQRATMVQRGFLPMSAPTNLPAMGGPRAVEDPGTVAREEPIGFPSTLVPKSSTLAITTRPEYTFRPSRLIVPASLAPNFMINDLKIANRSVFQNAVPIGAESFTQVAVGVALALATATVGQSIVIEVTNLDAAADHTFFATLIGTTIK